MAVDKKPMPKGRTRWRRAFPLIGPAFGMVALMIGLVMTGTLAVSFAVSGSQFTVKADTLQSTGTDANGLAFYQFGVGDFQANGTVVPQVESVLPHASLSNLCQSVSVGPLTMRITAGDAGTAVTATNLVVDASSLTANSATFTNINIGQDMSNYGLQYPGARGADTSPNVITVPIVRGTFGQVATGVTIDHVGQIAYGTSASSFTLPHLNLAFGAPC